MIKHLVFWRLKESANGNTRQQNAILIKRDLESLAGKIPGMIKIEVGIDFSKTGESSDVVLYSEFETREDLDNYQSHPDHKALMPFIKEARSERRVIDYEM